MGAAAVVIAWLRIWFVALTCVLPLLGASAGLGAPSVVVYPITATGATDPAAGGNIAVLIATQLGATGAVVVIPATPGTDRAHFLDVASALGADYYVTGFLTALGGESSLITQVVSTHSGSVVYSTTAVVRTYADAVAQADPLRAAILRHAGRGLAALDAPSAAPSSTPRPAVSDRSVNIGNVLRRRGRPTAQPTASPAATPIAVRASSQASTPTGVPRESVPALLFRVGGANDERTRSYATNELANAMRRAGLLVTIRDSAASPARARESCKAGSGKTVLYAASLVVGTTAGRLPTASFDVATYDCAGRVVGSQRRRAAAKPGIRGGSAIELAAGLVAADLAKARR